MKKTLMLGLVGLMLLVLPAFMGRSEALDFFVPNLDVTGTLANSKFIFTGKKFAGDFCAGSQAGFPQGMVIVYTGNDPAARSVSITTNGQDPGTRIPAPTNNGLQCTDTDLGAIHKFVGTPD